MRNILIFIIIFLIFPTYQVFALRDFRDGFVVTILNDTVYGEINYRTNTRNYKSCSFRQGKNIITYSPEQISGFGYLNDKFYTSTIVIGSFVEVLVSGEICLYKYKSLFYLKKDGELYKLESSKVAVHVERKMAIRESSQWKGIVAFLVGDCIPNSSFILKNLSLNEKSLTELIVKYNKCIESDFVVIKGNKAWTKVEIGGAIDITQSSIILKSKHIDFPYLVNSYRSIDPAFGLVLSISSPRIAEKISFQPEVHFTKSYYSALLEVNNKYTTEFHDTFIDLTTISIPISLKYSFPENKYSFYLQAGLNFDYHIKANTTLLSEYVYNYIVYSFEDIAFDINPFPLGLMSSLGIVKSFNKYKCNAAIKYLRMNEFNTNKGLNIDNNKMSFTIIFSK
jgi:hypothetical protein